MKDKGYGKRKNRCLLTILGAFLVFAASFAAHADQKLYVAAVAGFIEPLREIAAAFEEETGASVIVSFASAGRLYAQIENGAPYDLYLSADVERPALLYDKSLCEKPFVYAEGEVILWSADPHFCGPASWREALAQKAVKKIAIPNPSTAVHGTHAKVALQQAGLWAPLASKLVIGQDIAQVFQYATIGAVNAAFCSPVHARSEAGRKGCFYPVREAAPVIYSGCVLANSPQREAARRFAKFCGSPVARRIKNKYGYKEAIYDK
ncbi:MAG: molybdate ABC transporter substrate-binding protein [Pseudomonadota bacterium]|nr:molybdate ABC transporter substrate-binding protein [Pseudomonadota bacterium]